MIDLFCDLKIENGDLVIPKQEDGPPINGEPERLRGIDVIAQDIQNLVREHYPKELVAARPAEKAAKLQSIMLAIEDGDSRVEPGSVTVTEQDGNISIHARTLTGEEIFP